MPDLRIAYSVGHPFLGDIFLRIAYSVGHPFLGDIFQTYELQRLKDFVRQESLQDTSRCLTLYSRFSIS
jgi:hypothetical protein